MKLRGGEYELPELATKVSRWSPTCALVGVQVTLARPPACPKETPAGSRRLLILPLARRSKLTTSPALTAYAVPSRGVGDCQRSLNCGPRVVPAPAPTTATRAASAASATSALRRYVFIVLSVNQKERGDSKVAPLGCPSCEAQPVNG